MTQRDFIEIHSPKIIGTPSEGGSAIFKLEYFTRSAYLAQSPQLFKQMAVLGDLTRVIEIGPVFRAENSQTHRHLTEYVGLDAEMAIRSTYLEVLDELEQVVVYIITNLQAEYEGLLHAAATPDFDTTGSENATPAGGAEGAVDGVQLLGAPGGFKPIRATVDSETIESLGLGDDTNGIASSDKYGGRVSDADCPVLRMKFDHAIELLRDFGVLSEAEAKTVNDLSSAQEKKLGELIKARYGVDLYIVDQYHLSARPFYTMPLGDKHSRSFDMFLRGEEICSGAQRVHDVELLTQRAKACGVSTELIADYLNAFRYGAWPHGGFGLGLERLVMFLVGLPNVRQTSLFPRDPKRLTP
jgi:aspartyl/asparaginyl-tRNA synthetase